MGGVNVDGTFAKCHKTWGSNLHRCKSCNAQPILLCQQCADVCHQSCEKEEALLRSLLHWILQYNPCSCEASGRCKLKPPTRNSLWSASETAIAIVIVIVSALITSKVLIVIKSSN